MNALGNVEAGGLALRFQRRFLAVSVPIMVVASLLASLAYATWQYRWIENGIRGRMAVNLPGIAMSVADPLWSFRYEQVRRVLEGLAKNPDIIAATVFDELGHPVATIGSVPEAEGAKPIRQLIDRVSYSGTMPLGDNQTQPERAGSLVVWPSMNRAWTGALYALVASLGLALLAGMIAILAISHLLRRMLLRPLGELLGNLRAGRRGVETIPEVWQADEEIAQIISIFHAQGTAQADGERALRDSQSRLSRLYNGTPALLYSVDRHGCLLGVNDHWLAATGYERPAVLGMPLASLLSSASARRYREEVLPRLLETGRTPEARLQLVRADGRMMEVLLAEVLERNGPAGTAVSLSVMTDISPLQLAERQLERSARTDPLTGLLNRVGFMRGAGAALSGGLRFSGGAVLLQINFDRFKWVNDTHGMTVGDRVLVTLAERLSAAAGDEAVTARLSGDEFAVLLSGNAKVNPVVERIRATLAEPVLQAGLRLDLGASIGMARYPADGTTLDALLGAADLAMLVAKREGRRQLVAFGADHARAQRHRQALRRKVQAALEQERFEIHIQPIIRLEDGAVAGAEVLARLKGPDGEPIPPSDFIPAAEESGQIVVLGRLVMERALAALPGLAASSGNPDFYLAINLSAGQVSEDLPDEVAALAARHGVEPRQVVFEITETALFYDEARAGEVLAALAARGFRFALDDFGTGHSSVGYLTRLPVHLVKIERSFTASLGAAETPGERRRRAIVRAVVALSQELELPVVAEGVETPEELAAVIAIGIPLVQGYHFARPMAPADAEAWLDARQRAQGADQLTTLAPPVAPG